MKKLKRLYLRMLFWVEKKFFLRTLSYCHQDNLFIFPLFIDLEFNSEKYWNNFLTGIPIKDTALSFIKIKKISFTRHLKRVGKEVPDEVQDRLENILYIREKRNEIKHYFGEDALN